MRWKSSPNGKKCPKCGLINPISALTCDCGHRFTSKANCTQSLRTQTPGSIAALILPIIAHDMESITSSEFFLPTKLSHDETFNLLIFLSFCYFDAVRFHVRIEKEKRVAIEESLKDILLLTTIALYSSNTKHGKMNRPSLFDRGRALFSSFDGISPLAATDGTKFSMNVAKLVFKGTRANTLSARALYLRYSLTLDIGHTFDGFLLTAENDVDFVV